MAMLRSISSEDFDVVSNIAWAIEDGLPVSPAHSQQLKELARQGGRVGAAAAVRVVSVEGQEAKDEMLELMFNRVADYNLCCNGIAPALRSFATVEDAKRIAVVADGIDCPEDEDRIGGFVHGSAELLAGMDIETIRRAMVPADTTEELSKGRALVLCSLLREQKTTGALKLAGELLIRGVEKIGVTIYFIARFSENDLDSAWNTFAPTHVEKLIERVMKQDGWSMQALRKLCSARVDLSETVKQAAERRTGIERAALLYGASTPYMQALFSGLEDLTVLDSKARCLSPVDLLHHMECDWSGKEELFVKLLRLRDARLAKSLFGGRYPPNIDGLGKLRIGPIDWWLDWMVEEETETKDWQFVEGLAGLFGNYLDHGQQENLVAEFNRPDSRYRRTLMRFILPHFTGFTTDAFSEDAVAYMLRDLKSGQSASSLGGHVIGALATEEFISTHLLPQLQTADGHRSESLHRILRQAGARFGVRYFA